MIFGIRLLTCTLTMTYPDRLEDQDRYTGLGAQKDFSSFLFSVVFPEKIH